MCLPFDASMKNKSRSRIKIYIRCYVLCCAGLAVLLDNVQVFESVACGTGATCHPRLAPRSGHACACDEQGFYGQCSF